MQRVYNKLAKTIACTLPIVLSSGWAQAAEPNVQRIVVNVNETKSDLEATVANLSTVTGVDVETVTETSIPNTYILTIRESGSMTKSMLVSNLKVQETFNWLAPERIFKASYVPNDERYNLLWHYNSSPASVNTEAAWDLTRGEGAIVAVIDTGILPHPDLQANTLPGIDMISLNQLSNDGDGRDTDATDPGDWCDEVGSNSSWHGTHVAGTVAAVGDDNRGIPGVAFDAKILPIRALGQCGGSSFDIAEGILWAAGLEVNGLPRNPNPAHVINMSLGGQGDCDNFTQQAIDLARQAGATIVVAAGNEDQNAQNVSPANCDGVITVAAMNRQGNRAFYSNFGNAVDVAAPGGDGANPVYSADNTGTRGAEQNVIAGKIGTSMAAPHVAGIAALLKSAKPGLTPDEVETAIKNSARNFVGNCNGCGAGMADAHAALVEVLDIQANTVNISGLENTANTIDKQFIIDSIANGPFNPSVLSIKFDTLPARGNILINGQNTDTETEYPFSAIDVMTLQIGTTNELQDSFVWHFEAGGTALSDAITTTIDIINVNEAPTVSRPIGNRMLDQGGIVGIDLTEHFFDRDNDTLTFTATGLPRGVAINDQNQLIGRPEQSGTFNVVVTASDAEASIETTFTLTVRPRDENGSGSGNGGLDDEEAAGSTSLLALLLLAFGRRRKFQ